MLKLIQALFEGIWALLKGIFSLLKGIFLFLEGIDSFFESINSIGSVSSKSQKQPQQSSSFDKTMKKIFAGLFLLLGFLISAAAPATISDPYASPEEYEGMLAGFFILGLPCLVGGIWLTVGIVQQNQREKEEQQKAESDRLREIFFRLVKKENGEMTVLRFAMEAQISGDQAKQYLDEYAKQYDATFNVGDEGEISYQFHLKRNSGTPIFGNKVKNNSQKKQPNHSFEFRFPIQFSNPIASKEKPSHPPAESPTPSHSPIENTNPSHSPAENIHSQTESPTEQPKPSQSIEDSHPPEDTKPSHSSPDKEQPQAENSLVDAISHKISEGVQLPIQFSNPLTSKEKPSHPPAESPTPSHSPIENTNPSHSPAENIHSQTESPTEQPKPSQSIEDSHPPEDTKPSHSSPDKEQPQAENSLVDAISHKISEGVQLPIQFSNPITSKTEQQNQSTSSQTDQDQNHPNLENAKQNLSNLFGKVSKMMK